MIIPRAAKGVGAGSKLSGTGLPVKYKKWFQSQFKGTLCIIYSKKRLSVKNVF